jgi:hypothetical protein
VLLNIFDLYRLADPDEDHDDDWTVIAWTRQRWWYKLVHVCRQWRNIILQSPSLLDLHLFCSYGVPVAKMLARSPPLPLIISYNCTDQSPVISAKEESGILLALSHRDRVRRILLWELPNLGKFITAMEGQFPVLERMNIHSQTEVDLPATFQAPNLRHLGLTTPSLPIRSPFLTTTTRLTYLNLNNIPASAYFPTSYLLARLSIMLQLEILSIRFHSQLTNRDVERQPPHTPQVTLPNLRRFVFQGMATYLDSLVDRISAPSLSRLAVFLFHERPVTAPHLSHFLQTCENYRFSAVKVAFQVNSVQVDVVTPRSPRLELHILCSNLYLQVPSAVDILSALSPVLSVAKKVTITDNVINRYPISRDVVGRYYWREFLGLFTNVKAIHVHPLVGFVEEIFRSLLPAKREPPLELLPNLEEIRCSTGPRVAARDAISAFIDTRRVAGHLISLHMINFFEYLDDSDSDVN